MKISEVTHFLEGIKNDYGDIEVASITGFWIRPTGKTGAKMVVPSVGKGKAIDDLIEEFHART